MKRTFEIRQDATTNLFGIVKTEDPATWIIKPTYSEIKPFKPHGLKQSSIQKMDVLFELLVKHQNNYLYSAGILNLESGKIILDYLTTQITFYKVFEQHQHLLEIRDNTIKGDNTGLFDLITEKIVVPCKYKSFQEFDTDTNLIECSVSNYAYPYGRGIIDMVKGEEVLKPEFSFSIKRGSYNYLASHPLQLMAENFHSKKVGIVDKRKGIVLPVNYTISDSGFIKKPDQYNSETFFYMLVNEVGKTGILNQEMEVLFPFEYDAIRIIDQFVDNTNIIYALTKKEGKWGMVTSDGAIKIPFKYDDLCFMDGYDYRPLKLLINGAIAVEATINGKKGIITGSEKIILPFEYSLIRSFLYKDNLFKVKIENKTGLVSEKNEIIVPIEYDDVDSMIIDNTYFYRFFATKKNNLLGVFDIEGAANMSPKYVNIKVLSFNNAVLAQVSNGKKYGLINGKEEPILPIEYDAFWNGGIIKNVIGVQKKKLWGIVDTNNKVILPCEYYSIINNALPKDGSILIKKEKGSPYIRLMVDELIEKGYEKVLNTINGKEAKTGSLVLTEGTELVYEIGDFDAEDKVKVMLLSVNPQLVFSNALKSDKEYKETTFVNEKTIKNSSELYEIAQGNFPSGETFCPFFRLSDQMYQELLTNKKTNLSKLFGLEEGSYMKFKKEKKHAIKTDGSKIELHVLQAEIYQKQEGKETMKGSMTIWKNAEFPLVISADAFGGECSIKLKEVV